MIEKLYLYLIADPSYCSYHSLQEVVERATNGGVTMVQLRHKNAPIHEMIEEARTLKKLLTPRGIPLIINDHLEVALAVDADGVHLGQADGCCISAREKLGAKKIIGLSVENLEQGYAAQTLPADYLGAGPIFPTTSKADAALAWGLPALRKLTSFSKQPVVAIGGINQSNLNAIRQTNVAGVAIISAICSVRDPCNAARELSVKQP